MRQMIPGVILFFAMVAIPCAAMSKDTSATKKLEKEVKVQVGKGYGYVLKERMNFETTMFHLKSMLESHDNEKATFLLRRRIDYLKGSLLRVIADEGFTKDEKEKIRKLNKLEINWLEKKIKEVEG